MAGRRRRGRAARSTCAATRTSRPRSTCWRSGSSPAPATRRTPGRTRAALKEQLPTAAAIGDLAALEQPAGRRARPRPTSKAGEVAAAREQARADADRRQGGTGRRGRADRRVGDVVEGVRRPAARDRRGVEADQGHRPQDRRRAVEAVRRRPRRVRPAPRPALRPARRRARHREGRQGEAHRAGRGAVRLLRLERDRRRDARPDDASGRPRRGPRRDVEDALWTRFRAAQDAFFARRSEIFAERDAEQVENQRKKEAIIAEAAALDVSDPKAAQAALRDLQAEFDEIGHVPRDAMRRIDDRMRAAEQRVRDAVDAEWRAAQRRVEPVPGRAARPAGRGRGEARAGPQVRRRGADRQGRGRGRAAPLAAARLIATSARLSARGGAISVSAATRGQRTGAAADRRAAWRRRVRRRRRSRRASAGASVMPASATRWCGAA